MSTTERERVVEELRALIRYHTTTEPSEAVCRQAADRILAARLEGGDHDDLLQVVIDYGFDPMAGVRLVDWLSDRPSSTEGNANDSTDR